MPFNYNLGGVDVNVLLPFNLITAKTNGTLEASELVYPYGWTPGIKKTKAKDGFVNQTNNIGFEMTETASFTFLEDTEITLVMPVFLDGILESTMPMGRTINLFCDLTVSIPNSEVITLTFNNEMIPSSNEWHLIKRRALIPRGTYQKLSVYVASTVSRDAATVLHFGVPMLATGDIELKGKSFIKRVLTDAFNTTTSTLVKQQELIIDLDFTKASEFKSTYRVGGKDVKLSRHKALFFTGILPDTEDAKRKLRANKNRRLTMSQFCDTFGYVIDIYQLINSRKIPYRHLEIVISDAGVYLLIRNEYLQHNEYKHTYVFPAVLPGDVAKIHKLKIQHSNLGASVGIYINGNPLLVPVNSDTTQLLDLTIPQASINTTKDNIVTIEHITPYDENIGTINHLTLYSPVYDYKEAFTPFSTFIGLLDYTFDISTCKADLIGKLIPAEKLFEVKTDIRTFTVHRNVDSRELYGYMGGVMLYQHGDIVTETRMTLATRTVTYSDMTTTVIDGDYPNTNPELVVLRGCKLVNYATLSAGVHRKITTLQYPINIKNLVLINNNMPYDVELQVINAANNIYKFTTGSFKSLRPYYFEKNTFSTNYVVDNAISQYMKIKNYIADLNNRTVPPMIANFQEIDFNFFGTGLAGEYDDGLDYYDKTFIGLIGLDIKYMHAYLKSALGNERYMLTVADIPALNLFKNNTHGEIPSTFPAPYTTTFTNPRILLQFKMEDEYPFSIFYNGEVIKDGYHSIYVGGIQYVYIDRTELNTTIELTDTFEIQIHPATTPYVSHAINLVNQGNLNTIPAGEELSSRFNKLGIASIINGTVVVITDNEASIGLITGSPNQILLDAHFPNNATFLNNPIKLFAKDIYLTHEETFVTGSYALSLLDLADFEYTSTDKNHYRLFVDGRYIARDLYEIVRPSLTNGLTSMSVYPKVITDNSKPVTIKFEYLPNPVKELMRLDVISTNGRVSIDKSKLLYPLSTRYYDIYMNGKKISDYDISEVSDSHICITTEETIRNLVICERVKFKDLITYKYNQTDSEWDNYIKTVSDITAMVGELVNIQDNEPDIYLQYERIKFLHLMLYDEHIRSKQVDAMIRTNPDILERFQDLMNNDGIIFLDARLDMIKPMPV